MTKPVAIIIIFGAAVLPDGSPSATLRSRVTSALRWAARLDDAVFLPTGGVGRHGPAEAVVMARLLREAGVAPERILIERTARNTMASADACARMLRGHAGPSLSGPVFAASSLYHLPRCLMLLRLAGVHARACPPPRASGSFSRRWYMRMRELAALPVDLALGAIQLRATRRDRTAGLR